MRNCNPPRNHSHRLTKRGNRLGFFLFCPVLALAFWLPHLSAREPSAVGELDFNPPGHSKGESIMASNGRSHLSLGPADRLPVQSLFELFLDSNHGALTLDEYPSLSRDQRFESEPTIAADWRIVGRKGEDLVLTFEVVAAGAEPATWIYGLLTLAALAVTAGSSLACVIAPYHAAKVCRLPSPKGRTR